MVEGQMFSTKIVMETDAVLMWGKLERIVPQLNVSNKR